jgi:ribosomal protein L11 methyltransferase
MSQVRVFLRVPEAFARTAATAIEAEFEADGLAVAAFEVDEALRLWEIAVYGDAAQRQEIEARMRARLSPDDCLIEHEELPEADWVSESLRGLKPVEAGRYLVHGSHDRAARRPGRLCIEIDAGQAFGTGHHGTTAGCLLAIESELRQQRPRRILDLGTGSGVLAIAIAKSLRKPVLASDIDPVAVTVARRNFSLNGVGGLASAIVATGFRHRTISLRAPYDLIVANILARPLQLLAPAFARHAAPRATVILSGLLAEQCWQVAAAFRNAGFALRRKSVLEGWATLMLKKT